MNEPVLPPSADLRFPSIEALRAFEAAARLGSFERAADELAVTASAVSKRIATLEDLLGAALLSRGGRALTLTALGKEYLGQVRAALGLLAAVPLHQRARQRRRTLRVSAPPTFSRHVLVPALPAWTAMHPEVELEVVLSIPYLQDGAGVEADVEVRHGPLGSPGMALLMDEAVLPAASPALIERHGRPRLPADLAGWPLLRTPVEPWQPWFRAAGLDWPEPVDGPRLVDLGLTLEAALGGQGVALVRPSLARGWLQRGELCALFDLPARPAQQYQVRIRSGDLAAAAFADWLASVCEAAVAQGHAALSGRA
ncbi:LysR substrate-binding domain-containing protein [Sphaerotilus mobilis]|uniref:DNA-binding transcriptional LysR family regulator n=1 Tax=Sphaerotilus mobilis TaxID=47994 RepID=A0A4Q7LLU7_9BURK|nr:LysR substrate-binding domain-containing protein [Sphaerotilus mobilis]RZS54539.1 DNA-binding transcriptional LysR family regulator [Sphaerotilus mobilis]